MQSYCAVDIPKLLKSPDCCCHEEDYPEGYFETNEIARTI
jgi:hypothetical protein